jgi:AcrR family transcriptional regulator
MAPRPYRMSQRAASTEDTRQRIVEATYALHVEKGVAATTFRDISTRADVGIGTIYQHFSDYDEVITACGNHAFTLMRLPQASMFVGISRPEQRIRLLVGEIFAFYQRFPAFGRFRGERHQFKALEGGIAYEEQNRRELVAAVFHQGRSTKQLRALAFALLDFNVYQSLRSGGVPHDAAVEEITNILLSRARKTRKIK